MTQEVPRRNFDEIWESLSSDEQDACASLSGGDWETGYDQEDLLGLGLTNEVINSLVKKEMLVTHPEKPTFLRLFSASFQTFAEGKLT